jgi:hypothetical protein
MRHHAFAAACLFLGTAAPLTAQQPAQRQVDSLARELRALRARIDSLVTELQRLRAAPAPGDTTPVADELARLRAAAQAAVRDTAVPRPPSRDRALNQLNPEISVTADVQAQRDAFAAREVEISFQSALDPFSHTKIFVGVGDEVEIEEAYAYWSGLPGRLRLDVGKLRQPLGELNRWHGHALPESEYPLALTTFTGEEGLAAAGLSLYRAFRGAGTHEIWAQLTQGANSVLFDDGTAPAVLGHVNTFWQLSGATYAQVGITGVWGTNRDVNLTTTLAGIDARITWRPPARALYREWTVRTELYRLDKRRGGVSDARYGAYAGTTYRLDRRWIVGLRADYAESPEGPLTIERALIPTVTWWQSEWVFVRAELLPRGLALQAVWSIGPHKHETY